MKFLLGFACAIFICIAHANSPLRVYGIGKTFEDAKNNAFKVAVQHKAGIVLLSDRESKNAELIRNEITTYSSGYVDNFVIISQIVKNNMFEIVMDVYVNESKISQRLFSNSQETKTFEGLRHSVQINTLLQERTTGDKFVRQVLSSYPKQAYNIKQLPYFLRFDNNRNLQLIVQYSIQWNPNFLNALYEMLEVIDEGKNDISQRFPGNVYLVNETTYHETRKHYKFYDLIKVNAIRSHFSNQNEVRLMLLIRNVNHQIIGKKCYVPDFVVGKHKPMYSLGQPNTVIIWQNEVENNHVTFQLNTGDAEKISAIINELELKIVTDKECSN